MEAPPVVCDVCSPSAVCYVVGYRKVITTDGLVAWLVRTTNGTRHKNVVPNSVCKAGQGYATGGVAVLSVLTVQVVVACSIDRTNQ